MKDELKTKELLIQELQKLRQRNAEIEQRAHELAAQMELVEEKLRDEIAGREQLAEALHSNEQRYAELYHREQAARAEVEAALERLAESEKQYREMGEAIPYGVWLCGPDGGARYVSPSFLELLDMTWEEMQQFGWTSRLPPEDVEPMMRKWMHCVRTGELWDDEHRIYDRDGQIHTVLTRGRPVRDEAGNITSWVGINLDITARKQMEVELRRAKEAAEEAGRAKDQLFATVSHELRTPLALILGPIQKRLASGGLNDEERRDLEVVERNARTLLRHVNDLLDLSKLQVGKMEMDYVEMDLAWLVRMAASLFESIADERQVHFVVEAPPKLPAQADPDKLQRVLLNLLSNAFKFTPAGGGVAVQLQSENQKAVLTVRDTGPGIPASQREAIFERFQQLDAGAARLWGGTGLGLAIVKEFVLLHQGTVRVGDAPGAGALFTVDLPLKAPAGAPVRTEPKELDSGLRRQAVDELRAPRRPIPTPASTPLVNAPLVLIVEDNQEMCSFLAEALGREYRVITASDGREGLEKALQSRPDLILSDVMMPRMSGDQMVHEIRRHSELDAVPIVLLTAKADESLRDALLRDAVQDYIFKPFSSSEVLARVARLIAERRRNEDQIARAYTLLRAVTEGVEEAIFVKNLQGNYLMINGAGAKRFGKESAEEVLGKKDREFFPAEVVATIRGRDHEVVEKGKLQTYEETLPVSGAERVFLTSKAPYRDAEGNNIGIIGISHDITDRKRTEMELRQLKTELEERVEQRTAELAAANRELEAFSYSVSHDLRTPLRHIDGFLGLLEKNAGPVLDDKGRRYIRLISEAVKRMGGLIDDLLVFSRVGRTSMAETAVSLHKLVDEARLELAPDMGDRVIDWSIGSLPDVRGDPTLLKSAMVNLLSNAIKFTRQKSPARIEVGSRELEDGQVVCFVRDNGAGFDMRFVDRLFGVFQRLHRPEDFEGTGIGLANVRRIVERHGGKIWAEGAVGRGAAFYFSLPVK